MDELVRVLLNDDDGRVPLCDKLRRLRATAVHHAKGYGLLNPHALAPSTCDDVRNNAWLTIAGPAGENNCAINLAMCNENLRDCFRELYPAFRNAYPTPNLSFDFIRRRYA